MTATSTWHLRGFWASQLSSSHLLGKYFIHWLRFPITKLPILRSGPSTKPEQELPWPHPLSHLREGHTHWHLWAPFLLHLLPADPHSASLDCQSAKRSLWPWLYCLWPTYTWFWAQNGVSKTVWHSRSIFHSFRRLLVASEKELTFTHVYFMILMTSWTPFAFSFGPFTISLSFSVFWIKFVTFIR